ncbi:TonB-dependent receptor domain-containing protein [Alteraurantiacibacter buctensis]|uniref:TonB-dependent receptor n=1 Tax=Alteraurantiacibacter buctensis TaxID=1503981 RepID=A0A844YT74_9SPHN|nr:TonB-dependent receptor [Alteraurantiacibacter buctensis]MXO70071.1 TonB-dependent receptor [Alteraurantiacibacter buctensis]
MTTGKHLAGLLLLSTALSFPTLVRAQDDAAADVPQDGLPVAEDAAEDDVDISIPGGDTIIVTGRVNRDPTRNSSQVISVLSAEQIERTGDGDIAGALSRVTGLSVVGSGRVFVRGLGDRYSLAMLNGLPLPSPEPLSRVVPLDIFPTNVIASSLVQKTYSPNFPGEFGGGVINLTTRAVPEESFLSISGSVSGETETTFQNGYDYYGSGSDWTGFDGGARTLQPLLRNYLETSILTGESIGSLPQSRIEEIAYSLTPRNFTTLQVFDKLRPNFSGGITAGTAFDIGDDQRLGLVVTGNLSNGYRNRTILRQSAGANETTYSRNGVDRRTDNNILANALFSAGLEMGDHVIRWTNLFIRDTVKQSQLGAFTIADLDPAEFLEQNTAWYSRQLMDTQMVGEFDFGVVDVDLRGGFARTERKAPHNLSYTYVRTNDATTYGDVYRVDLTGSGQQALQRTGLIASFSELSEELWFGGIDVSYELADTIQTTVGYAYSDTDRYSTRRAFQPRASVDLDFLGLGQPLDPAVTPALLQILEAAGTRTTSQLLNAAVYNMFNVNLQEFGATTPAFGAELTIHGAYGQLQWSPSSTFTVQGGVRYETADQSSTPIGAASNPALGRTLSNDYFLPAATVTWEPVPDLQLRFSGSQTIARPQFRELVAQVYFDPETNRGYEGNPALVDSELLNLEARAEYYLGRQSRVSVAGFYKKIDNPIEAFLNGTGNISYANAPTAELYGGELDAQYTVDLLGLGDAFASKQLLLLANYTYTQSSVSAGDEPIAVFDGTNVVPNFRASQIFDDGSPLVGQSDHLVNLQVSFEDTDQLQQLTVLTSYASTRTVFRSQGGLPDVIEKPGINLDVVARQGITIGGVEMELKLEGRNLLGTRHQEYQINSAGLRIDSNTYDVGQSFSAGLSITF